MMHLMFHYQQTKRDSWSCLLLFFFVLLMTPMQFGIMSPNLCRICVKTIIYIFFKQSQGGALAPAVELGRNRDKVYSSHRGCELLPDGTDQFQTGF